MARRLRLEDFGRAATAGGGGAAAPAAVPEASETERLDIYETGYAAGWEDALQAGAEDGRRISAGLEAALADLSFTYHEAHGHVLGAVKPLMLECISKLLPSVARAALPDLVGERLSSLLDRAARAPMMLSVSPADEARVAAILPEDPGFPLEMKVDDTLAEGQVVLRAGTIEEEIDLASTTAEIAAAITEFFAADPASEDDHRSAAHG